MRDRLLVLFVGLAIVGLILGGTVALVVAVSGFPGPAGAGPREPWLSAECSWVLEAAWIRVRHYPETRGFSTVDDRGMRSEWNLDMDIDVDAIRRRSDGVDVVCHLAGEHDLPRGGDW